MPKPLSKDVDVHLFVDASHANDKVNRRSRTGYFVFLNKALIQWCSKKQFIFHKNPQLKLQYLELNLWQ